ncbi:hypothetical protein LOTGIDRAFT_164541 [Lottia gigantea]|uniref:Cadherin domain-containing protein n=1 Tax=Lottia gigantea TaxID=225164 RepID=V4BLZ2_LOTGI|nr:hypothetical protein LOTGIDRAFT_164541 [Lottia gigantea]ESO89854.1 hypothetical protein LOTGIDRAFT_164541 [Lottia gigantea]
MSKCAAFFIILGLYTVTVKAVSPTFDNVATDGSTRVAVDERTAPGVTVFSLLATDGDGDPITFSLDTIDGATTGDFVLVGAEIRVKTGATLDFEAKTQYVLEVSASDGNDPDAFGTVTIDIGNLNDESPVLGGTFSVSVDEEQAVGTLVPFNITVTDGDVGDTKSFTLTGPHSTFFQIDNGDGSIRFAEKLDRDGAGAIIVYDQLIVRVTDGGGNTDSNGLSVTLQDINDNTPICTPSSYFTSTPENTPANIVIETLTCADLDAGANGNFVLSIASGDDASPKFVINGFQIQTTTTAIDYEALVTQSFQYQLIVNAVDGGATPKTGTASVIVTITSINEGTPVWTAFSPAYTVGVPYVISEDTAVGTTVVTIAATDTDAGTDGDISYKLVYVVDGGGTARPGVFSLDTSTGTLITVKNIDRDVATGGTPSYDVTVRAKDGGTPSFFVDRTLTFDITDVNDISPEFGSSSYSVTISENLNVGDSVIQVLATDLDSTPSTLIYNIQSGDATGSFTFSTTTDGLLEVQSDIDIDRPKNNPTVYSLIITAKDGGAPELTGSASVIITITPENDFVPTFGTTLPGDTVMVSESTVPGVTVATVLANDDDYGTDGVLSYFITGGNTNSAFTVDSTTGQVKTMKTLDFETTPTYFLEVIAKDGGTPALSSSTTVTVSISNVNENVPTCVSYNIVASVAEDTTVNSPVTSLTCTDADGDVLAYSITSGNTGSSLSLDSSSGTLTIATALDYETVPSYTLAINIIDQAVPGPVKTTTAQITVQIVPVNEFDPVFPVGGYTISIPENQALFVNFLTVTATDSDQGASHGTSKYSIIGGNPLGEFQIDSSSGQIQAIKALNREAYPSYTLNVKATDSTPSAGDERSTDTTVVITINDINDNPPVFTPTSQNIYVLETAPSSSNLLTLNANDDDTGANAVLTYSILSDPSGFFTISTNALILNTPLDFETATTHIVVVQAVDGGSPKLTGTATVTINVLPANDNTPVFTVPNTATSLSETTPVGNSIFDASASDTDVGDGSDITYSITSGDPTGNTYFINPNTGRVFLWSVLDYDTAPNTYNLTLKVEDTGGLTDTMWLFINVTDENDEYPIFTTNTYNGAVDEEAAPRPVLQVQAIDKDSGVNGQVTYSIVSGDGVGSFNIDSTSGDITTSVTLDYEVKQIYYLVVQAVDGGVPALTSSCLVRIAVNDINDKTPVFVPADFTVNIAENVSVGTSVTTVNANDADSAANSNNVFTYILTNLYFEVHPNTGVITNKAALDRETIEMHKLVVEARDQGTPSLTGTATVTVIVDDINDNSPVITGTYDRIVVEDTSVGTLLFTVLATDADSGLNGKLTFSIAAGNTDNDFKIDSDGGFVQVQNSLDRERRTVYNLQIKVDDNGAVRNSDFITIDLTIGDINDNDPIFTGLPYTFNIHENEIVDTSVGTLVATDADTGVNADLLYSLPNFWSGNPAHLKINGITGIITTEIILDREVTATYFVWCRVKDGGNPSREAYTNATIVVLDKNDNFPLFDSSSYSVTTLENSNVGTSILRITVTDKDEGVNKDFTLSIDTSTTGGALANTYLIIDTVTQTLSVKLLIDRELTPTFSFNILAVDKGTPALTSSAAVTITVLDENDNEPIFNPVFYNSEASYAGQCTRNILTVTATDRDDGNNGEVVYFLLQSSYDYLFNIDPLTGLLTLKASTTTDFNYLLTARARDNGLPLQTSSVGATLRVDTFTPNNVVITFNMKISRTDFLARQNDFVAGLKNLLLVKYPTSSIKIWCIEERAGTALLPPTRRRLLSTNPVSVHVYALKDNTTNLEVNKNSAKSFLTYDDLLSFYTTDPDGSPSAALTGNNWDYYSIETIKPYQETTTPWEETDEGIAIIVIICLVLLALIILLFLLCFRRYRQKQKTSIITERRGHKNDLAKVMAVPKNAVPDIDEDIKKHPAPAAVLSLPMPVESKANKRYDEDFFWSSDVKRPNTSSTLPAVEDSTNFARDNRYFDGMAIDPDSGKVYEYNTKTNERKWLNSSDGNPTRVSNLDLY